MTGGGGGGEVVMSRTELFSSNCPGVISWGSSVVQG